MLKQSEYKGPLAGLNVVDFGHYYAGPMTAMMMADQGASVIRIERPGEPELPEQQYRVLNRNKKLLPLDLKTEEGKSQAVSLIERADVVIENFRPGVMKRLGLDYASVKEKNPGLIYLSLPGFASTDKERAPIQAWEGVMCAASCLYTETSIFREKFGFPPVFSWIPHASMYGGILGMLTVTAALLKREEVGVGTVIEIPMADATMMLLTYKIWCHSGGFDSLDAPNGVPDALKHLMYKPDDSDAVIEEKLAELTWDAFDLPATMRAHYCADGRQIFHWPNGIEKFNTRLLKALGVYRQLISEGFVDYGCWVQGYDNNISDAPGLSSERKQRLAEVIKEAFLTKPAAEWESILLAEPGVPSGMFRTREDWVSLEPLQSSGVFTKMNNGTSELTVAGRFADVTDADGNLVEPQFKEAESLTVESLEALLQSPPSSAQNASFQDKVSPVKKGDLLKNLKVLDFCNVAAGPIGCATLAQYGADVIKVDPTEFLIGPSGLVSCAQYFHGKRTILIDPASAQTREVLERLFLWADVVVQNSVDGTAERLGVSYDQVKAINPKAVVCQLSAFGGTYRGRGGWEKRIGFDPSIQAICGMMTQFGTIEHPQWHGCVATTDIMGAYSTCIAALLGVYQQRKTGRGAEARTSLARMINYVQLPFMIMENGNNDWGEARGQFAVGHPGQWWQRMYVCQDGEWIFAGAHETRACEFAEMLLGTKITDQDEVDEKALEAAFAKQDCAAWETLLQEAGFGSHRVMSGADVFAKFPRRQMGNGEFEGTAPVSTEVLAWPDHPWGLPVVQMAPNFVRVGEDHSWYAPKTGEALGADTQDILRQVGFDQTEIDAMIENKSVHEYLTALGGKGIYHLGQKPKG